MPPPSVPEKDTVSIHFVRSALMKLRAGARQRVLSAAGINRDWLVSDSARVPATAFAALWLAVNRELDDEFFGLDRRRMKVGSFALISHGVLHSRDLLHALRRMLLAFATVLDDVQAELAVEGDEAVIRIHNRIRGQAAQRFAEETFLVMVHGLLCWLGGRRIALTRADFGFARPAHAAEHAVMFTHALGYGAPQTVIRLDATVLQGRVVQSEATLKQFLRDAPQSVFLKYKNGDSWTARLRRRLRQADGGDWPTLDAVAAEFHIAPSTLARRLEAEGASFQFVKDDVRRDLAIHQLYETPLSVGEIAASLGFEDASAFRRAFKKWTNARPTSYRRNPASDGHPTPL